MAALSHPPCATLLDVQRPTAAPPEVSVVIPLYNYGRFVVEALESVHAQTLADLDVIVVDDGSTDGSAAVAQDWLRAHADRFCRACVLRHLQNSGLAATRNQGFQQTATPFVFALDADNALYPSCLEKLLRSLRPSAAAFSFCLIEQFGPGVKAGEVPLMHLTPWNVGKFAEGNYIDAMALLRRAVWEQLGGYTRTMPPHGWEDFDLWLKLARAGGHGLHVPQILARYRVHGTSMLRTVTDRHASRRELENYFHETYPEFFPRRP